MRCISLFLSSLLFLNPLFAQSGGGGQRVKDDGALHVRLVDEPGPAQLRTAAAKGYVLQVTNSAGGPVAGAAVALRLPEDGATGRFANDLRAWVAYSDSAGIAQFPVIQWGDIPGDAEIKVTAAKGAAHAEFLIPQRIGSGPDNGSVSVVSVPVQTDRPPAKNSQTAIANPVVAIAKPAPAAMPDIDLPSVRSNIPSKPLADVVPPSEPLPVQPAQASVPPVVDPSSARSGATGQQEKQHPLTPNPPPPKDGNSEPTVTITNSPTGAGGSQSHKKMWLLVGIGGGAAAAALLGILAAHAGGAAGGAGSGSSSGVAIGAPTVTVSH